MLASNILELKSQTPYGPREPSYPSAIGQLINTLVQLGKGRNFGDVTGKQ
jgi:hypothetical protein